MISIGKMKIDDVCAAPAARKERLQLDQPIPVMGKPGFSDAPDEDQMALRFAHAVPQAALCTIVGIDGSFSRRLGAQLAVGPDGGTVGSLSDGCLERELATQAQAIRAALGPPRTLRYGQGSPFIDFRLPCGSGLDVVVDAAPDRTAIAQTVERLDRRKPAALALPVDNSGLLQRRAYWPSLRLVICGVGPEADWLAKLAEGFGVSSVVVGPDRGLGMGSAPSWLEVDEWTAVILLFHDHEWEQAILEWALATPAFYIGAIGGKQTRENRRALLADRGATNAQIARVRSPIGLIEHARDARLLALSVLSEVAGAYEHTRSQPL